MGNNHGCPDDEVSCEDKLGCADDLFSFEAMNMVIEEEPDFEDLGDVDVHALVCYVDYGFIPPAPGSWNPPDFGGKLDTMENAQMFKTLLEDAGCKSITEINNLDCTKEDMLEAIKKVDEKTDGNDVFVFFYSGHGANVQDQDGDEEDGLDEAMCLPNKNGEVEPHTWLRDDDFSEAVAKVHAGQKIFVLDCCHSGTILDFNKKHWKNQFAISLCGCKDNEESAALGGGTRGGAFTKSICAAAREIGSEKCSLARVYNTTLRRSKEFIPNGHTQNIAIACARGLDPNQMEWPLSIMD